MQHPLLGLVSAAWSQGAETSERSQLVRTGESTTPRSFAIVSFAVVQDMLYDLATANNEPIRVTHGKTATPEVEADTRFFWTS